MISNILKNILAFIAAAVIFAVSKLIWLTCSKERVLSRACEDMEASREPIIYAFWHGRMFAFSFLKPKHRKIYTIISRHGDGQLITDVMKFCGIDAIRGSTNKNRGDLSKRGTLKNLHGTVNRGGSFVIREAIKTLKRGDCIAVTPDGPRGPRFIFKSNFLNVASMSKAPIIPITFSAARAWVIPSWDRMLIPKPFAKIKILYGEPIYMPRMDSQEELEKYGKQVENALNDITSKLDNEFNIRLN